MPEAIRTDVEGGQAQGTSPESAVTIDENRGDAPKEGQTVDDYQAEKRADIARKVRERREAERAAAVASGQLPPQGDPQAQQVAVEEEEEEEEEEEDPTPNEPRPDPQDELEEEEEDEEPAPKKERMVRLVVDGEEVVKPYSEIKRIAQKNMAADKRLAEAAERARNLDERERNLQARERAGNVLSQNRDASAVANEPSPQDARRQEEVAKKLAKAIYDGTQEDIEQAAREVLAAQSRPQASQQTKVPDQREIANSVATLLEVKAAKKSFAEAFPEIASDESLYDLADKETIAIRDEHPDWSVTEVVMEAGKKVRNKVREWAGVPAGGDGEVTPPKKSTAPNERKTKKRTIEVITGNSHVNQPPAAPRARTRSEVIAQMRKDRGLPVY